MITWVFLLTVTCLDGHTQTNTLRYRSGEAAAVELQDLEINNQILVAGHKKCYVSYAEWFTEETIDQTTETKESE